MRKALYLLSVVCLVLLFMSPAAAVADDKHKRIYGQDRIATALAICDEGWPNGSKTVILAPANQENLIDALAASSLAGQFDVPILLTYKDRLDQQVRNKILNMGVGMVYIVGGICDPVIDEVKDMPNVGVTVLKGKDRWETAKKINDLLVDPAGSIVVGYNALADALSVSSYAAANRYAIVLADGRGNIPQGQELYGSSTIVVGSTSEIPPISGETRISGSDRFERNAKMLEALSYSYNRVYIANGNDNHLVDALVISPLAGRNRSPILLSDNITLGSSGIVNACINTDTEVIALGGPSVVSDSISSLISYTPVDLRVETSSQVSLNCIRLKFSEQVDPVTAQDPENYTINGETLTRGKFAGSVPLLQEDLQTVYIVLYRPSAQGETVRLGINSSSIYDKNKSKTCLEYSSDITFSDDDLPEIQKISLFEENNLKIKFTEPVRTPSLEDCEKWTLNTITLEDYKLESVEPVYELNGFTLEIILKMNSRFASGKYTLRVKGGSPGGQLSDAAMLTVREKDYEFLVE